VVDGLEEKVLAYGSPALELNDENTIVINKTDLINEGTVVILANKAAHDLKEELREKIKNENTKIKILLEI
jgi:hypothetical protein